MMNEFKKTTLIESFLSSTLLVIIFFLAILSSQLLYSLMLSDVDTKTYEYGMLRALGFKSSHLVGMITLQSFFYSVPGVIAGVTVAAIINVSLRFLIYMFAQNQDTFRLSSTSLWIGCTFGFVMPLLSILLPIQQALGKNLRTSLDLNHRANNETSVTV